MLKHYRMSPWMFVKSFLNKVFQLLAYLSFPSPVRVFFQKLKGVKIGSGAVIGAYVYIDERCPDQIAIGDGAMITACCIIIAHQRNLAQYRVGVNVEDCPLYSAPVKIGRGAHIGMGSIILPGVTIGEGAVIGAGAVVSKDIPPYALAVGIPARVIKTFTNE